MARSFQWGAALPKVLTVPGLDGSGPDHWQSLWEYALPDCDRIELGDWNDPQRELWTDRLDAAIARQQTPFILVGHSLGCMAIAWWARSRWHVSRRHHLLGAMFVAPPNVEEERVTDRIAAFAPPPRDQLPFPSILVASRNDPYASFQWSAELADDWGSQLIDAGLTGHINAQSDLGLWEKGVGYLESLIASVADARRSVRSRHDSIGSIAQPAPSVEDPVPANWRRFVGPRKSNRMTEDERSYFQERAEAEIGLAQRAVHPSAVRSHYLLAGYYLDLVHCGEPFPAPEPAEPDRSDRPTPDYRPAAPH